jgi:hypothetical protein
MTTLKNDTRGLCKRKVNVDHSPGTVPAALPLQAGQGQFKTFKVYTWFAYLHEAEEICLHKVYTHDLSFSKRLL